MFLSHAEIAGPLTSLRNPLTAAQVLLTPQSAALLEAAGHPLGTRGLVTPYGRPFALGTLRVELFPSGRGPGAASLLCESALGRIVFAGPVNLQPVAPGGAPAEVRPADAVCVDATFADPLLALPSTPAVLDQALSFAESTLATGAQPVVLAACESPTLELARALDAAGFTLRAHPSFLKLAAVHAQAGLGPPPLRRLGRTLGTKEVLLWTPQARQAGALVSLPRPVVALVSGFATRPGVLERVGATVALPLCGGASPADLLAYVDACGARQIGTVNDLEGRFAAHLRERGFEAYPLGPPAQMTLFEQQLST